MTTTTTPRLGYSEAHFDPRNRWGGDKVHAVDETRLWTTRAGHERSFALCGADVHVSGGSGFDPESSQSCKRCVKALAKATS